MTYILHIPYLGTFFFSRYPSVALARNENGHKKCGADIMRWWCGHQSSRNLCPIPAQTYRGHHARDPRIDTAVADDWCWGAEAEGQAIAGDGRCSCARRRARQSMREYELIWLLQRRLRAESWPHWRLRCMQPLHDHGMGVVRP